MSKAEQAQGSVKVVSKAVAVLNALADVPDATPAELAKQLNEPRGTVYRLVSALEEHDLVEPGMRRGSFQLGLRLFRLGSAVARRFDGERAAALPAMEELHTETRQTVFLTVREGFEALCLERLDGELVGIMILPVGGTVPLHGGANARGLLAFEPPEFWDEYLEHGPLEAFTPRTEISREGLTAQLKTIREDGFSISDEDVIPGIASIGAPIFGHDGHVQASISLSGPRPAILGETREGNITLVREAATAISRQLGHDGGGS